MNWLLFPPFVKEQMSSERHSNLPKVIQQASTTTCLNQGLDSGLFSKFILSPPDQPVSLMVVILPGLKLWILRILSLQLDDKFLKYKNKV